MQEEKKKVELVVPQLGNKEIDHDQKLADNQEEMFIIDYTDKSFAVVGSTRQFKDQLKSWGGRFNGRLGAREASGTNPGFEGGAGWIFSKNKTSRQQLESFITQANSHGPPKAVTADATNGGPFALPTVVMGNTEEPLYQRVSFRAFKPRKNMQVKVLVGMGLIEGTVTKVESNRDVITTAYMSHTDGVSKLVLFATGDWQVWGLLSDHKVRFHSS